MRSMLLVLPWLGTALAYHLPHKPCPTVKGDFSIEVQDLYSESAAWDPVTCRLYLSAAYNLTLVSFDPYTNTSEVFDIPNLSNHGIVNYTAYHLNGVDYDPYTGRIWIAAGSADAFTTSMSADLSKQTLSGPNRILEFDPVAKTFVNDYSLDDAAKTYRDKLGKNTSGFQDIAETSNGDTYAIGTYGNSIVKIPAGSNSAPELWYAPQTYNNTYGFGGILALGNKLIISDLISGGLVTFDTTAKGPPKPKYVPLQGLPANYKPMFADGLFAPTKYHGKIALWSDDFNGTSVYGSNDNWESAHYLGLIHNDAATAADGGFAVATFDIGDRIFSVNEFFQVPLPPKPRSSFPIFDITDRIDAIVRANGTFCA